MGYFIKEFENGDYDLEEIEDIFLLMLTMFGEELNGRNRHLILNRLNKIDIKRKMSYEFEKLTDQERYVLRLRYGIDADKSHTLEEIGKRLSRTSEYIRQLEESALSKLQSPIHLPYIKNVSAVRKYPISNPLNFKDKIILELDDLIFKKRCKTDTLLFHILMKQNITITVTNFVYPPEISIDDLDLSIRSYNCVKRAGINNVQELIDLSDDDILRIRNLGKNQVIEIRNKISEFINKTKDIEKNNQATIDINIERNGNITKYSYTLDTNSLSNVPKYIFEELFPNNERSLIHQKYTYFSTYVNEFLLLLGYVDLDQVYEDRKKLDRYLYDLGIIEDENYFTDRYYDFIHLHATYYPISNKTYQELQEEMKYIEESNHNNKKILKEKINHLIKEKLKTELQSRLS